jgi:hypothetical protein
MQATLWNDGLPLLPAINYDKLRLLQTKRQTHREVGTQSHGSAWNIIQIARLPKVAHSFGGFCLTKNRASWEFRRMHFEAETFVS